MVSIRKKAVTNSLDARSNQRINVSWPQKSFSWRESRKNTRISCNTFPFMERGNFMHPKDGMHASHQSERRCRSGSREVRSVAGVSDINGRSERSRDISFGLPQGANTPTRLTAAGRFVVAQKPGLNPPQADPAGVACGTLLLAIKP